MLQVQGVSALNNNTVQKKQSVARPTQVAVRAGENLSIIAKRYGMSYQDFMKWTGLTSTKIYAGQKISLPQEAMPAGKGLSYLANKSNMSLNEFCKLNNISDYRTYVPKAGEKFYAYSKTKTSSSQKAPSAAAKVSTPVKKQPATVAVTNPIAPKVPTGGVGNVNKDSDKKLKLGNGKSFTAGALRQDAIRSAKNDVKNKFKDYCHKNHISYDENLLNMSPIDKYPLPTVGSNGKITATETVLQPTGKANGKVVILNAGHGGYRKDSGIFDPGAITFVKQGNNYVPQLECQKAAEYANESAAALRARGYKVVILSGAANTIQDIIPKYKNQYGSSNVALISLHFKGTGNEKFGMDILHDAPNDKNYDTDLKNSLVKTYTANDSLRAAGKNGLAVLNSSRKMPSVLIEIDRIDSTKANSASFRADFAQKLVVVANNTLS